MPSCTANRGTHIANYSRLASIFWCVYYDLVHFHCTCFHILMCLLWPGSFPLYLLPYSDVFTMTWFISIVLASIFWCVYYDLVHFHCTCFHILMCLLWPGSFPLFSHLKLQSKYFQLTHLPLDKMAAIPQTLFSDAFSWMKSFVFWSRFHWILFLRVQLTITQHWFG